MLLSSICVALSAILAVHGQDVPTPVGKCDAGRMTVTIPTSSIPFKGAIHVRGFRQNAKCFTNSSTTSFAPPVLVINMLASPGDDDYCGIISLKDGREKGVSIAIRSHSSLELQDDKYFLLTCSNIKTATKGSRTSKSLKDKDQEGLTFYDLEPGHSTRPVAILGKSYDFGPKESGQFIGSCIAFGATPDPNSVVELLDAKGCPSDAAIVSSAEFKTDEGSTSRHMKVKIRSMFRFPNRDFRKREPSDKEEYWLDNLVTIQCTAVPCPNGQCPSPCTREGGNLLTESSSSQSLVTTSVHVLNPGMECDHEVQHQLTRDWLIALLVCLGVLLLVMFCVNLFMCSSMACTCVRHEVVDTSSLDGRSQYPTSAYDYDPYKSQGSHLDHPLYASINRKQHPHSTIGHFQERDAYSLGGRTRHSNYY